MNHRLLRKHAIRSEFARSFQGSNGENKNTLRVPGLNDGVERRADGRGEYVTRWSVCGKTGVVKKEKTATTWTTSEKGSHRINEKKELGGESHSQRSEEKPTHNRDVY